jgi:hypothetical protein
MRHHHGRRPGRYLIVLAAIGGLLGSTWSNVAAVGPNTVAQWNAIAEDNVVKAGTFQNEAWVYMAYAQIAVYDAVVAIDGGYVPYGTPLAAPAGASADAAVVEAAYETLANYLPSRAPFLTASYSTALGALLPGQATTDGLAVGHAAAAQIIALRTGDGRKTPIATTSAFPTLPPGPGVWRLTPPYAAPQTPWVGDVRPFVLSSADRFLPPPPPSLSSPEWVAEYNEVKAVGQDTSTVRTAAQTATAEFWTANVIRQYNQVVRALADVHALGLLQTARLAAMVNVVAADAGISSMNAKYHYLFWRPVTAIDPTSVESSGDGFGPSPGFDDGNPATVQQVGWRPLLTTPNHPEYPGAHGTVTSAMAEVLSDFLGTNRIDVDIHGFDAAGAPGNFDAVHHFARANDLRAEIVNARTWGGLHYRGSTVAGVDLGRSVAKYDLRNAFEPVR